MANFQSISTGILKEHGIVSRPFVIPRSFDVLGACVTGNLSQPIDVCRTLSPKRDTAAVRPVQRRFSDPKKVRRPGRLDGFELQPSLDGHTAREAQWGQQRFIERSCFGETVHAEINVIVSSCHSRDATEGRSSTYATSGLSGCDGSQTGVTEHLLLNLVDRLSERAVEALAGTELARRIEVFVEGR
jgi:hypothetical protein